MANGKRIYYLITWDILLPAKK